jgi:hypothetical protein
MSVLPITHDFNPFAPFEVTDQERAAQKRHQDAKNRKLAVDLIYEKCEQDVDGYRAFKTLLEAEWPRLVNAGEFKDCMTVGEANRREEELREEA